MTTYVYVEATLEQWLAASDKELDVLRDCIIDKEELSLKQYSFAVLFGDKEELLEAIEERIGP